MPEVLHRYDDTVKSADGIAYRAQVCGRERDDGLWEGWIEFLPEGAGGGLRTERETTQPNRKDILYWSEGLSAVYLEGALERALRLPTPSIEAVDHQGPAFSKPAPAATTAVAILDPFSIHRKGKDLLRKELKALGAWHLRNVIRAHGLADEHRVDLDGLGREELAELIVAEVEARSAQTAS